MLCGFWVYMTTTFAMGVWCFICGLNLLIWVCMVLFWFVRALSDADRCDTW